MLLRRKPRIEATISTAAAKNPARGRGNALVCVSSGCQRATKSPPGPNLQSGSTCLIGSGVIFVPSLCKSQISNPSALLRTCLRFQNVYQRLFLSARRPKLPKQKPNKNRPGLDFFHALSMAALIAGKIWDHPEKNLSPRFNQYQLATKTQRHKEKQNNPDVHRDRMTNVEYRISKDSARSPSFIIRHLLFAIRYSISISCLGAFVANRKINYRLQNWDSVRAALR
ncbi:MAG: hypothetical protein A2Z25_09790 [Planctomycetes bacterium RBG_16_55_9]|nr:MAG: hypothetical protein A2Z25_09790 [Planctomycetes bacterium RBG_16_55_9]